MPEPPRPWSRTQPQLVEPPRVGIRTAELQQHGIGFVLHHEANLPDGFLQAHCAVQAGGEQGVRGAVLLQLHLHDVSGV